MNTNVYNHFERFDIEGDEGTQPNFSSEEHVKIPIINSLLLELKEIQRALEIPDHHGCKEARQDELRQGPVKRKPRKRADLNVIPDHIYQSWQRDTSDITRNETTKKERMDMLSTLREQSYMELPLIKFTEREIITNPSSELVHGIPPLHAEVNPGRSNKKRPYSSSRHSLEPVAEEPKFKISRLSENADEIPDHHGCKETRQDEQRQGPVKRKPRKEAGMVIDYEQTVIPDHIYQSWQQYF